MKKSLPSGSVRRGVTAAIIALSLVVATSTATPSWGATAPTPAPGATSKQVAPKACIRELASNVRAQAKATYDAASATAAALDAVAPYPGSPIQAVNQVFESIVVNVVTVLVSQLNGGMRFVEIAALDRVATELATVANENRSIALLKLEFSRFQRAVKDLMAATPGGLPLPTNPAPC